MKVQKDVPKIVPVLRTHGDVLTKLPELSLERITLPVGVVGLAEVSFTVTVQLVVFPTLMDPGAQDSHVVVECEGDRIVTDKLYLPLDVPV